MKMPMELLTDSGDVFRVIDKLFVADEAYSGVTQDGTTGTPLVEIHVPLRIGREM